MAIDGKTVSTLSSFFMKAEESSREKPSLLEKKRPLSILDRNFGVGCGLSSISATCNVYESLFSNKMIYNAMLHVKREYIEKFRLKTSKMNNALLLLKPQAEKQYNIHKLSPPDYGVFVINMLSLYEFAS